MDRLSDLARRIASWLLDASNARQLALADADERAQRARRSERDGAGG